MLLEMGQRAEALLAWEHCLTLSPHFQPARREMEKVSGLCHVPVLSQHTGRCPCPVKGSRVLSQQRHLLQGGEGCFGEKEGAWQPSYLLAFSS